jgi:hypothetical protein
MRQEQGTKAPTHLSRPGMFADGGQPQALLVSLQIGFHAGSAIVVIHDLVHGELRATGEDDGVIIATFLLCGECPHWYCESERTNSTASGTAATSRPGLEVADQVVMPLTSLRTRLWDLNFPVT